LRFIELLLRSICVWFHLINSELFTLAGRKACICPNILCKHLMLRLPFTTFSDFSTLLNNIGGYSDYKLSQLFGLIIIVEYSEWKQKQCLKYQMTPLTRKNDSFLTDFPIHRLCIISYKSDIIKSSQRHPHSNLHIHKLFGISILFSDRQQFLNIHYPCYLRPYL
jgi:hypothetical protein